MLYRQFILLCILFFSLLYAQPPHKPYLQVGHNTAVYTTAFSNSGRFIASGSWKKVVLWDRKSAKILHTMYHKDNAHVWSLTFSSDDKRLISASRKGHIIIWDVQSGKVIERFLAHDTTLLSIALSEDDRYLLSTSKKGAKVWDLKRLKPVQSFSLHEDGVIDSALYQSKNRYKAITMDEELLYIWDALSGKVEQKIYLDRELKSFGLDKDKNRLVLAVKQWIGDTNSSFYLYKLGSNKPIRILDTGEDDYKKVVFLDEKHIAGLAHWDGKERVDVFDLVGKKTGTYISPTQEMHTSLSVDVDTRELLIGDDSGAIFAVQEMKLKQHYDDKISFINDMTITDDGKWLVYATYSGKVYMYNFFSKAYRVFKKHTANTYKVTTNNTGLVASRDIDGNIFIYDLYYFKNGFKGKILSDMTLATHFLQEDQNFHLDLDNLANTDFEAMQKLKETLVLGAGKDTYVWGMQEFKAKQIIKNKKQLRAIDSTNKGNILVTADKAKQIKLYYRKKDKFSLSHTWNTQALPRDLKIAPDGLSIAVALKDNKICIYDIPTKKRTGCLATTPAWSESIHIGPNSRYLIYLDNEEVVVYDMQKQKLHAKIHHPYGYAQQAILSPNGKFLFVLGTGTISVYEGFAKNDIKLAFTRASFEDGEWVDMKPSGVFNASDGGQKYINIKKSAFSFDAISKQKYQKRYNDPDKLDDSYTWIWVDR